jgi:hypothetical protein
MKLHKITQLTALSALLMGSTTYAASNDALLDLLVQKGVLTQNEATAVAAELKEEAPAYVTAKGKAVSDIKLTGRLQLQYDGLSNDGDNSSQSGFYFRRVRLGAEAKLFDNYYANLIAAFGGDDGSVDLDKAVIGWKYDPMATFEAGYTKVPFGYYETTSSAKIKTVERSIANRFFAEDDGLRFNARHTGLFAKGDLGSGFSYAAAVVTNSEGNERSDRVRNDNDGLAVFGRLQWESDSLLLGADLGFKQDGSNFVDDGKPGAEGDLFGYGLHAKYSVGDFTVTGEVLGATVENVVGNDDADILGFTVIPSYKINDKWEVVASFSAIDTDGANLLDADDLVRRSNAPGLYETGQSYYLGFNYFIVGNDLKLTAGYEFAEFEDTNGNDLEVNGVRLRLQALF